MNNKQKQAQELLKEHRESIDRLDAVLIYTLGERFKQTQMVGKLKAEYNLPPADPAREEIQIARLGKLAEENNVNLEFEASVKFIITEVIQNHNKHQS